MRGFTVEEACSGEQAIGLFNPGLADLVLLDINMPGIGGLETCRRLRRLAVASYFYTDTPGILSSHQTTLTLGAIWWFGTKQGAW